MANLIFDLDGTLIDSYPSIIDKLIRINDVLNVHYSYDFIFDSIIKKSTNDYIEFLCKENDISREHYQEVYDSLKADLSLIRIYDDSIADTLSKLVNKGHKLFIYTHRGKSAYDVLKTLKINQYFVEVVDSSYGLARKPSGEGIKFLIDKYHLDPKETYYIGDREMDLLAGEDAGAGTIFFNSSGIPPITVPSYSINFFGELANIF